MTKGAIGSVQPQSRIQPDNRDVHEELHARLLETIGGLPPSYEGEAVAPVKR